MRRKLLFLIGFAAFGAGTAVVLGRGFDRTLFLETIESVRPLWLVASVGVTFGSYFLRAVRWRTLLRTFKPIGLGSLTTATVLGFAAIYAAGRAGEMVRPVWISRREGIPVAGSMAAIATERVFDAMLLLVLLNVGLHAVVTPPEADDLARQVQAAGTVILGVALTALGLFVFSHRFADAIAARIPFDRVRAIFRSAAEGMAPVSTPRSLVVVTAQSVLVWAAVALQFWLMLVGLDLDFPIAGAILVLGVSAIGSLAQLPGIGGGFQAAFVFTVTRFFDTPLETAVAAALGAWLVSYIPTLTAAGMYMFWKGIGTSDLAVGSSQGTAA